MKNFTLIHQNKTNEISQWNFNLNQIIHAYQKYKVVSEYLVLAWEENKQCDKYEDDLMEVTGESVDEEDYAESLK